MSAFTRSALGFYGRLLRLYPSVFQDQFASEMAFVFDLALADAAHRSAPAVLALLLKELADLPGALLVAHLRQRRKQGAPGPIPGSSGEARLLRWAARVVSLPVSGFLLSALLLSEDFRQAPTLPGVAAVVLCLIMLAGWRWEGPGGRMTLLGGPLFFLTILGYNLVVGRASLATILVGLVMALPFILVGWLFVSAAALEGAYAQVQALPSPEQIPGRRALIVRLALVALAGLLFLVLQFVGFFTTVGSNSVGGP